MIIRKVARMGHPVLREKARELSLEEIKSSKTLDLVRDMIVGMDEYGGIGIAAPQVHEPIQLAIMILDDWKGKVKLVEGHPSVAVFINPSIKILDKKCIGSWEGCLSLPGMRGYVERPKKIRVSFQDLQGNKHTEIASGHNAIVIQHELDHLEGTLYIDKIFDKSMIAFNDEYDRFHRKRNEDDNHDE